MTSPPVIEWRNRLGNAECPFVTRWKFELPHVGSVRVHHWTGPDDDRACHDHPWWFCTLVIRGRYADHTPGGIDRLRAGSFRYRPAEYRHYVIPEPEAWTILVTGPKKRSWGFWKDGRFRKANKWFASMGHHPCS